jgi:hypothetical protein
MSVSDSVVFWATALYFGVRYVDTGGGDFVMQHDCT